MNSANTSNFSPNKSWQTVKPASIHKYLGGLTTHSHKPVLEINSVTNTLTLCESFERRDRKACINCTEYTECPVYRRR